MATCTKNHDNEVRFRRHELPAFISKKCSYSPRVGRSSWKSITSITSAALLASLSSIIVPLSFQHRFCITRTGYVGLCQRTVLFLFLTLTNSGKYPVTCSKKRCNQFVSSFFTNRTSFILLSSYDHSVLYFTSTCNEIEPKQKFVSSTKYLRYFGYLLYFSTFCALCTSLHHNPRSTGYSCNKISILINLITR